MNIDHANDMFEKALDKLAEENKVLLATAGTKTLAGGARDGVCLPNLALAIDMIPSLGTAHTTELGTSKDEEARKYVFSKTSTPTPA